MSSLSRVAGGKTEGHFSGSLLDVLDHVEYRRADLGNGLDPVYRLRYEAYRRENFIPANPARVSGDQFDHAPNVFGFGVHIDGRLVSSIRLHHVTPEERSSPSRLMYPDILDPLLDAGESYIDPSRFTADRGATLAYPALPFLTLRLAAMASEFFRADYCLSSVRPEHVPFYRRVFGSKQLAGERYYPGLNFPLCLFAAEVPTIRDRVARRYPFFMSTKAERAALFGTQASYGTPVRPTARRAQRLASERAKEPEVGEATAC